MKILKFLFLLFNIYQSTNKQNSIHSAKATKTPLEIDIDALHKVLFRRN